MEKITITEFKARFLALISWGWRGQYAEELTEKANNPEQLAKIFNLTKLVAFRNSISLGDALHHLISHNKIK